MPKTNLKLLSARCALELEGLAAAPLLAVLPALPRGEGLPAGRADVLLLPRVRPGVPLQLPLRHTYPRAYLNVEKRVYTVGRLIQVSEG